ncbi:TPA: hypothetical protein ACGWER_001721 [Streptococcus agalactiae]|nr:hypothetical protein [Streptococcus agalactiae]HEO2267370.1 hypothetical protein [Streptococcus agalactiae]HEO7770457.1 hypothetical protein [Streptococcus agalactiae]
MISISYEEENVYIYSGDAYNEQIQADALDFEGDKHAFDNDLQSINLYIVCDAELTIDREFDTLEEAKAYVINKYGKIK